MSIKTGTIPCSAFIGLKPLPGLWNAILITNNVSK